MLVKLLTEHGVKPTIVVWDAGQSGRREVYTEYKATRTSRPDLLMQQWPHLEPLVEAFGYRNVSVEGYEADDVIATIACRARDAGIPVTIVTGDRDAFQLIDPDSRIKVMATSRGITETKTYDYQAVVDRYGIPPESIPDFYGLKGDTSDNIPGVPGIGDKTASELLQRFGDLDTVLASVDEISGAKRKQNLVDHAEAARISRQLATIQRDVPVEQPPLEELAREPDRSRLREVFREFELRDPLRRLEEALGEGDAAAPAPAAEQTVSARLREGTLADVERLAADAGLAIGMLAPETVEGELFSREAMLRFGVAVGDEVLVGDAPTPEAIVLAAGERPVTAHDAKSLGAVPANLAHDTLLGAFLLEPARRGFPFRELTEERGLAADVEDPAGAAALLVRELAAWQRERIEERGLAMLMDEIELPLVPVLRELEVEGVRLNVERLEEVGGRVREEVASLEREIWDLCDTEFTIGSPQQLGEVLFERLGLSRKRRGKTGFSTDARVLQAIREEHPIIPKIEQWRELSKLKLTYLDAFPELLADDGRLHTTFNQTATTTGRLSSTNPNLQNIPVRTEQGREIRACFVAEAGCSLVSADYSQVELRILAHIAGEEALKEIFKRGEDVHTATAAWILGEEGQKVDPGTRSKAKMVNYGIVYGLSAFGLADRLGIEQDEAQDFIDRYLERFPAVKAFIER